MVDTDGRVRAIGRAWIDDAWRNFYSMREVKRGKNKGKIEVTYIVGVGVMKTTIIDTGDMK
ncbi:MAG: hypothetical protein WC423_24875 [Vulcanimicrobiota bacterium]